MNGDTKRAAGFAFGAASVGLSQSGPAGLGFLVTAVDVPLWFIITAVAVPSGEVLAAGRAYIYKRTPIEPPRPESDE